MVIIIHLLNIAGTTNKQSTTLNQNDTRIKGISIKSTPLPPFQYPKLDSGAYIITENNMNSQTTTLICCMQQHIFLTNTYFKISRCVLFTGYQVL